MTCPICGKETLPRYRPFCSRRCADIDLARWLGGGYAIPGDAEEDVAPAAPPPEKPPGKPPGTPRQ